MKIGGNVSRTYRSCFGSTVTSLEPSSMISQEELFLCHGDSVCLIAFTECSKSTICTSMFSRKILSLISREPVQSVWWTEKSSTVLVTKDSLGSILILSSTFNGIQFSCNQTNTRCMSFKYYPLFSNRSLHQLDATSCAIMFWELLVG